MDEYYDEFEQEFADEDVARCGDLLQELGIELTAEEAAAAEDLFYGEDEAA